jgi:hypothetical protein
VKSEEVSYARGKAKQRDTAGDGVSRVRARVRAWLPGCLAAQCGYGCFQAP